LYSDSEDEDEDEDVFNDSLNIILDIAIEDPVSESDPNVDNEAQADSTNSTVIEQGAVEEVDLEGNQTAEQASSTNLPEPTLIADFLVVENRDELIREAAAEPEPEPEPANAIRSSEIRDLSVTQQPEHLASRVVDGVELYDDEPAETDLDIPQQTTARGFVKRWAVRVFSWVKRLFRSK